MKNRKKHTEVFIIGLIIILLVGAVSAVQIESSDSDIEVINTPADNWLGRIISKIQFSIFKVGTFSVYGDELGCAKYPTKIHPFKKGQTTTVTAGSGEAGFVNWFRGSPYDGTYSDHPGDSRQFMSEGFIEDRGSMSWTCDAGAYWDNDCYVDFYSCPLPCYSDSDCSSGEFCDKSVLSQKIPNAGVCKGEVPTHKTKVYRCSDGEKTYLNEVSHGNINFCTDPDDSKYLILTTDQCLPYEPSICREVPTNGEGCSIHQTRNQCNDDSNCEWEEGTWLVHGKCAEKISNGNGEDEVESKAIPLTEGEWNQATPRMIISAMCQVPSDCASRENYTVKCIYSDEIKNINKNAVNKLKESEGDFLAKLCQGVKFSWADIGVAGILKGAFWLTGGGYAYNFLCVDVEAEISGTCRVESKGFFANFAFFKITGDKTTDGAIILSGGILILFIIFSRLGGLYGEIKYEI